MHDAETGEIIDEGAGPRDPHQVRSFSTLVGMLEHGALNADASEKLEKLVADLNRAILDDRRAAGSVTVTIKLLAERGLIEVATDTKLVLPPKPRRRSLMFVSGGKFLSTNNPQQAELPLRSVSTEVRAIRDVPATATNQGA